MASERAASAHTAAADTAAQAVLDQLHPLLQPAPPSWAPQTVGWAVLVVVALLLLVWACWRGWRRWHAARHRRLALAKLRQLCGELRAPGRSAPERAAIARALPEIVRRLALAHAPRTDVAPLQGAAWAAWLDRTLGDTSQPFAHGAGRRLADWAYCPECDLPWDELEPLLALVERWVRCHRVPQAVR